MHDSLPLLVVTRITVFSVSALPPVSDSSVSALTLGSRVAAGQDAGALDVLIPGSTPMSSLGAMSICVMSCSRIPIECVTSLVGNESDQWKVIAVVTSQHELYYCTYYSVSFTSTSDVEASSSTSVHTHVYILFTFMYIHSHSFT